MLGANDERGMLLCNALKFLGQLTDVHNIGSEGQNKGCQSTGLSAGVHVDAVEVVVELWVITQQALVEDSRDVLAMLSQSGNGLID